jgi:hypothetical protein
VLLCCCAAVLLCCCAAVLLCCCAAVLLCCCALHQGDSFFPAEATTLLIWLTRVLWFSTCGGRQRRGVCEVASMHSCMEIDGEGCGSSWEWHEHTSVQCWGRLQACSSTAAPGNA